MMTKKFPHVQVQQVLIQLIMTIKTKALVNLLKALKSHKIGINYFFVHSLLSLTTGPKSVDGRSVKSNVFPASGPKFDDFAVR